jgi:hypothetical protein
MKNVRLIVLLGVTVLAVASCTLPPDLYYSSRNLPVNKTVDKIQSFPYLPSDYRFFDFKNAAIELDNILFHFAENEEVFLPFYIADDPSTWDPIGYWIDQPRQPPEYNPLQTGYLKRTFGMPTYVGDTRAISSGSEALNTISAVLGASYAGVDKQNQSFNDVVYDFVEMTFASYDTGSKLVYNFGLQGQEFWYDILPQIMFARLYDLYPYTPFMKEIVLIGADQWLKSLPNFIKDDEVNYEFVGYNVVLDSPTLGGNHLEPPNGGLAFLFYSAYQITSDVKYLNGAKEVLDYLQSYQKNPNYESLTDYAPWVAAVLNAKYGTDYDVGKFIDFLFDEDSSFRPGWSVMSGYFGDHAVHGLVGQANDYAFAMNSFHLASTLAPLVKYDVRYADDIGRYMLNLVANAQHFFPHHLPLSKQSMASYLPFDEEGVLIYEGFKREVNSIVGYAGGDATTIEKFGNLPSDLSVYSSAFMGSLGGLISPTNVHGILKTNLNTTDSFGFNNYPHYMFYNPFDIDKTIRFDGGQTPYDLYDLSSKSIIGRDLIGPINLLIPYQSSKVIVQLPQLTELVTDNHQIFIDNQLLSEIKPAVNLPNLTTRQSLTSAYQITIDVVLPLGEEIEEMSIYFNDILAYQGPSIETYSYDKQLLPDTDYTFKVEILTTNGLSDYVTKRVICW